MNEEFPYWLALAHMRKLWTKRKNQILAKCFESNKTIIDFFSSNKECWLNEYGITVDEIPFIEEAKNSLPNYSFQVEDLLNQGYDIIPIMSKIYSQTLKNNLKFNSPVVLYTKGNKDLLLQSSTAIVGSRNANDISLQFTDNIAKKSVMSNHVVVSGYAKGVDRQALDSAIKYEGKSIVVLPQGITTFGTGFKTLYKQIISGKVLVLSIFPPKVGWNVAYAMERNSIIYGLTEEIYVAQSDSKGGTFSGVQDGLKRNRSIFVRKPEPEEKNANLMLIDMGGKPVDINGNEVQIEKRKSLEELIRELISNRALTTKEIAIAIFNDEKQKGLVKKQLDKMKDIEIIQRYKYTIHLNSPSLF